MCTIDYLSSEYGYDRGTATGYLTPFKQYYHKGVYTMDFKKIPEENAAALKAVGCLISEKKLESISPMPASLFLGNNPPHDYSPDNKGYDVFISHASEDKDPVARPLANALVERGITVWYDEFEMKIGDSLRRKIDQGLAHSNFGIIIISRNFISKGWTNYELDGLITRSLTGEQQILPTGNERRGEQNREKE